MVIPVGDSPNLQYWSEALESVAKQTLTPDSILVVNVVRRANGAVPMLSRNDLNCRHLVYENADLNQITTFEQVKMGFEYCMGQSLEYISVMSANDALAPEKLEAEIDTMRADSRIRVSYPTVKECDDQLGFTNRIRKIARMVTFDTLMQQNFICDCSTVSVPTHREIPFDPQYQRASFWIWWFKIWSRFGPDAFRFHEKSAYLHRDHIGQLSSRPEWIESGKYHINKWLKEWAVENEGRVIA